MKTERLPKGLPAVDRIRARPTADTRNRSVVRRERKSAIAWAGENGNAESGDFEILNLNIETSRTAAAHMVRNVKRRGLLICDRL